MTRKETGILGEILAKDFLKKRGYRVIELNYRCRWGEIDIVSHRKDCLIFIEVRTKTSRDFGTPEESITAAKRARMRRTAEHYYQSHDKLPESWRIDLVAVELDKQGKPRRIEVIENAV